LLDTPIITWLAGRLPVAVPGSVFHRAALSAAHRRAYALADALFERAADRYRLDLEVEPLARLRVHQAIARLRASGNPSRHPADCLDIEQRIARLNTIETLEPPFERVPANRLLATWNATPAPVAVDSSLDEATSEIHAA